MISNADCQLWASSLWSCFLCDLLLEAMPKQLLRDGKMLALLFKEFNFIKIALNRAPVLSFFAKSFQFLNCSMTVSLMPNCFSGSRKSYVKDIELNSDVTHNSWHVCYTILNTANIFYFVAFYLKIPMSDPICLAIYDKVTPISPHLKDFNMSDVWNVFHQKKIQ